MLRKGRPIAFAECSVCCVTDLYQYETPRCYALCIWEQFLITTLTEPSFPAYPHDQGHVKQPGRYFLSSHRVGPGLPGIKQNIRKYCALPTTFYAMP
jgi:hypothetical protein